MLHHSQRATTDRIVSRLAFVIVAFVLVSPSMAHPSEFCEVLNRFNAEKKITDEGTRARFEGEYGSADDTDRRRTWNVETVCEEFLVVVPLWADVSPPVLAQEGETLFKDYTGNVWAFEVGDDGKAKSVKMTAPDGTVTEMRRLGDPRTFE